MGLKNSCFQSNLSFLKTKPIWRRKRAGTVENAVLLNRDEIKPISVSQQVDKAEAGKRVSHVPCWNFTSNALSLSMQNIQDQSFPYVTGASHFDRDTSAPPVPPRLIKGSSERQTSQTEKGPQGLLWNEHCQANYKHVQLSNSLESKLASNTITTDDMLKVGYHYSQAVPSRRNEMDLQVLKNELQDMDSRRTVPPPIPPRFFERPRT